jgi:hypothetical protein
VRNNSRKNGNRPRVVTGRAVAIPERIITRMKERTVSGALRVPRSRRACDIWTGSLTGSGYPQIHWFDRDARVDVVAPVIQLVYRIHRLDGAPIPDGHIVCHTCDVSTCVNPDHLYLGDPKYNGSDLGHRGSAKQQGILVENIGVQNFLRTGMLSDKPAWLRRQVRSQWEAA